GRVSTGVGRGDAPYYLAKGDFDGDGVTDLAVANYESRTVSLLLGPGTGGFRSVGEFSVGDRPYTLTALDFNADGNLDVLVITEDGELLALPGDGRGRFDQVEQILVTTSVSLSVTSLPPPGGGPVNPESDSRTTAGPPPREDRRAAGPADAARPQRQDLINALTGGGG